MKEKRITVPARGGSRRHGDPPAWLDKSLPWEQRRDLLDRAIRELDSLGQRSGPPPSDQPSRKSRLDK